MRLLSATALALFVAACGDNGGNPDAHVHVDSPNHDAKEFLDAPNIDIDGPPDAFVFHDAPIDAHVFLDAGIDAPFVDGIAGALATADGTGLTLPIDHVTVTYVKPQIGSLTNDPAGFTVQAQMIGPALFVAVDPATLVPPPVVGDVVSFTVTTMGTVGGQRRAQAVTAFARISQGADVAALAQDITAATDVVTNVADYDSEIVNLTGTMADAFAASGQGFQRTTITSTGITGDTNYQLRVPVTLVDALDMVATCGFTVHRVPVGHFTSTGGVTAAEIGAYVAGDITLTACPAPTVAGAISLSPTSVRITFTRNVAPGSVMVNGSQFTFDHGLVAMAAVVAGRTVTVTTTPQTGATTYTATVAAGVTDLQGTALGTPSTAMFSGFLSPAVVRINEVNANVAGGCDLIELRVVSGGSMSGYKIQERQGGSGELAFVFPTFNVATNDFIVIHESSASITCNANGATTETTSKIDQPAAMFAGNFDTAYDFWVADPGLTATDNVFTLYDATGTIIDALFASNDPAAVATAAATEAQAAVVGVANQWSPMMTTYIDAVFRMNAADDLDGTGTTAAGTSIQRIDNNDTNAKTDWTTGAGAASTWGALNAGQTAF